MKKNNFIPEGLDLPLTDEHFRAIIEHRTETVRNYIASLNYVKDSELSPYRIFQNLIADSGDFTIINQIEDFLETYPEYNNIGTKIGGSKVMSLSERVVRHIYEKVEDIEKYALYTLVLSFTPMPEDMIKSPDNERLELFLKNFEASKKPPKINDFHDGKYAGWDITCDNTFDPETDHLI